MANSDVMKVIRNCERLNPGCELYDIDGIITKANRSFVFELSISFF